MFEGNIENPTSFLADKNATSVLKPSDLKDGRRLNEILLEKHPKASPLFEETFNLSELSGSKVEEARKLLGSSGPSESDANHWFDALIMFGLESCSLRDLVSQISKRISDSILNTTTLDVDAHKTHVRNSNQSPQLENESKQSNTYKVM